MIKYSKIVALVAAIGLALGSSQLLASKKPNILVIWGDDIGWSNLSAYHRGLMGGSTPNIDRLADEGMLLLDYYGEQSCTAGRSAFITGQHPIRTGLTKVGMPGSTVGLQIEDPTIAALLKPLGYATGQFGKNHLGDRDEYLPTNHGFDEFFGNLYHLNAEEEPENPDYIQSEHFRSKFGPRGVIHSYADGKIEDTGSLTRKRMETVDEEFLAATFKFIDQAHSREQPFFVWFNATRMHVWTHLKESSRNATGYGVYADGLREHDQLVGQLLDKLDTLGISDNTIVIYSTDNGAEVFSWPDGGSTPFRGEKNTTWEGGFRVPALVRWPGTVPAGSVSNKVMSHLDWLPTLLSAAGEPDIRASLLRGHQAGERRYKVHLDGHDQTEMLSGSGDSARDEIFYFTDDGILSALRFGDWKLVFSEQRAKGWDVWREPYVALRMPKVFNLRSDPFERADQESIDYDHWSIDRLFLNYEGQHRVQSFLNTFEDFPQRQRPASFTIDQLVEKKLAKPAQSR